MKRLNKADSNESPPFQGLNNWTPIVIPIQARGFDMIPIMIPVKTMRFMSHGSTVP